MRTSSKIQDTFMAATSLAEIARLAIDDLEAQCLRPKRRLDAVMARWVNVAAVDDKKYTICAVCLAGACLVNRGWVDSRDQKTLAKIYEENSNTIFAMFPDKLGGRMDALDHLRNLDVKQAVLAVRGTPKGPASPKLLEKCDELRDRFRATNVESKLESGKAPNTGTNYLSMENQHQKLTPEEVADSIRFFRQLVIPKLAKAGL